MEAFGGVAGELGERERGDVLPGGEALALAGGPQLQPADAEGLSPAKRASLAFGVAKNTRRFVDKRVELFDGDIEAKLETPLKGRCKHVAQIWWYELTGSP